MMRPAPIDPAPSDWLDVNGRALRYRVDGHGEPIVLVHEIGGCIESWDAVASGLARDYTVIRYDQRAAGQSEKSAQSFTVHDLADDLGELIAALGIPGPVRLVGAAFGAAQVLLHAAAHPDRVESIALLAPASDIAESSRRVLEARSRGAVESGMRSVLPESLDRAWPEHRRAGHAEFSRFRARYLSIDPQSFAQHNMALAEIDLGDALQQVQCPVLAIAGRHDPVRSIGNVHQLAARLPHSTEVVVDAAHFIAAEAPHAVITQLRRFFGTNERARPRHVDIPESELTAPQRSAIDEAVAGTRGRVPAPMRAWLVNPEFARRAQSLGETLRYRTSLEPRLSELAILVTARLWRSDYEWRVHSVAAAAAGLDDRVIERIRLGLAPAFGANDEDVVFEVALALHKQRRIGDPLFERATTTLGRLGLAELVGILGYYTLVSMTLNVYEIDVIGADSPFPTSSPEGDAHDRT